MSLALHCQSGISLSIQNQEHTDIVPLPPLRRQKGGATVKCAAFCVVYTAKLFRYPFLNASFCSLIANDGPKIAKHMFLLSFN